jgi:hypothetical protein
MSCESALNFLAFIFTKRRKAKVVQKEYSVEHIDWAALRSAVETVSDFIDAKSDSGKVGQAFASALLDLIYSSDFVDQGNSQDPDAGVPGDVHVRGIENEIWLWVEVKQQPVQTGQVIGFIDKVSDNNGERILYFALKNSDYPNDISSKKLEIYSAKKSVRVTVFESPGEAFDWFLEFAPGSYSQILAAFLSGMQSRLDESGCSKETLGQFEALASTLSAK